MRQRQEERAKEEEQLREQQLVRELEEQRAQLERLAEQQRQEAEQASFRRKLLEADALEASAQVAAAARGATGGQLGADEEPEEEDPLSYWDRLISK